MACLGPVAAAPGENAAEAARCKDGGYLTYVRVDGSSFKNEGQCTAYAAQGNAPVPRKSAVLTFVANSTPGYCTPVLSVSGYEPGSYLVVFSSRTGGYLNVVVDATGNGSVEGHSFFDRALKGASIYAAISGMFATNGTADC